MSERVSRVVLTERCAPIGRHSQGPSACLKGAKRRHCAPCALWRALRRAAPQRERSQVREVSGVPCRTTTVRFPNRIRRTMPACGEVRPMTHTIHASKNDQSSVTFRIVGLASSRHRLVRTFVYSVSLRSASPNRSQIVGCVSRSGQWQFTLSSRQRT